MTMQRIKSPDLQCMSSKWKHPPCKRFILLTLSASQHWCSQTPKVKVQASHHQAGLRLPVLQLTKRSHFERVRSKIADMILFSRPHFQQPLARIRGCVDRMKEQPLLALSPRLQASAGMRSCRPCP